MEKLKNIFLREKNKSYEKPQENDQTKNSPDQSKTLHQSLIIPNSSTRETQQKIDKMVEENKGKLENPREILQAAYTMYKKNEEENMDNIIKKSKKPEDHEYIGINESLSDEDEKIEIEVTTDEEAKNLISELKQNKKIYSEIVAFGFSFDKHGTKDETRYFRISEEMNVKMSKLTDYLEAKYEDLSNRLARTDIENYNIKSLKEIIRHGKEIIKLERKLVENFEEIINTHYNSYPNTDDIYDTLDERKKIYGSLKKNCPADDIKMTEHKYTELVMGLTKDLELGAKEFLNKQHSIGNDHSPNFARRSHQLKLLEGKLMYHATENKKSQLEEHKKQIRTAWTALEDQNTPQTAIALQETLQSCFKDIQSLREYAEITSRSMPPSLLPKPEEGISAQLLNPYETSCKTALTHCRSAVEKLKQYVLGNNKDKNMQKDISEEIESILKNLHHVFKDKSLSKSQFEIDREDTQGDLYFDEHIFDPFDKVLDPAKSQYAQDTYLSWMENKLTSLNLLSEEKIRHPTENPYMSSIMGGREIIPNNIDNMQRIIRYAEIIEDIL